MQHLLLLHLHHQVVHEHHSRTFRGHAAPTPNSPKTGLVRGSKGREQTMNAGIVCVCVITQCQDKTKHNMIFKGPVSPINLRFLPPAVWDRHTLKVYYIFPEICIQPLLYKLCNGLDLSKSTFSENETCLSARRAPTGSKWTYIPYK